MLNISWANRWTSILVMNVTTLRTFPGHTAMGAFDLTTGVTWFRWRVPETSMWCSWDGTTRCTTSGADQDNLTHPGQSTMTWSEAASNTVAGRMFEVPQSRPWIPRLRIPHVYSCIPGTRNGEKLRVFGFPSYEFHWLVDIELYS